MKPVALAVLTDLPDPPRSGNHLRYLQNLRLLHGLGYEVAVVAGAVRPDAADAGVGPHAELVEQVLVPEPLRTSWARARRLGSFAATAAGIRKRDPFAHAYAQAGIGPAIARAVQRRHPDVILLRSFFVEAALEVRTQGMLVVADLHDASSLMAAMLARQARPTARAGLLLRAAAARSSEALLRDVDEVWVPSEREQSYYASRLPGVPLLVVPNGIEVPREVSISPLSGRLLLVGNFGWPPNVSAADTLVEEILPRVLDARPEVVVDLVGRDLPRNRLARWRALPVEWHGYVSDVDPYYRRADAFVFVAPSTAKTALPLKLAQAFASGLPVVASAGAVGGLQMSDGSEVLIANDAAAGAAAVLALFADDELRGQLARAGHRWAQTQLGPDAILASLQRDSVIAKALTPIDNTAPN
jgi:glycosyltransferase involved in cell wall biosynthesis